MPLVFLIAALFMSPALYASVAAINFSSTAFVSGLSSNVLNLDHICLSLMAGQLLFVSYRRPWLLSSILIGTTFGIGLGAELGPLPFAQFLVGLSLVLLIAILSLPQKFEKYLTLTLAGIGVMHGILHANRWGSFATFGDAIYFILGVLLGLAFLSISFGLIMNSLATKAEGLHKEAEHILVAMASGAALASIVIGFS